VALLINPIGGRKRIPDQLLQTLCIQVTRCGNEIDVRIRLVILAVHALIKLLSPRINPLLMLTGSLPGIIDVDGIVLSESKMCLWCLGETDESSALAIRVD
jgi:hypothetical protein